MGNDSLQSALAIIQLAVGVITLTSVAFYLGKHSNKLENNVEEMGKARAELDELKEEMGKIRTDIAGLRIMVRARDWEYGKSGD